MKVCEKVQKKGITTYNEVADELVAEFSSSDNHMSPNDSVSAAFSQSDANPCNIRQKFVKGHDILLDRTTKLSFNIFWLS